MCKPLLTGQAQNTACKAKTDARSCGHHNEVDPFLRAEPDFGSQVGRWRLTLSNPSLNRLDAESKRLKL